MWRIERRILQARGHDVFSPTLTGLGERRHLASPTVNLSLHIADVVNELELEDLHDVILVGHGYGGMVVTGVVDRVPRRIAQLVYLDAFVPEGGQALADIVPQRRVLEDGWLMPALPETRLGRIEPGGLPDPTIWRLVNQRGPQPFLTMTEPLRLTNPSAPELPRSYIYCTDKEQSDVFEQFARRLAADPLWRSYQIDTDHYPMLTTPRELAEILSTIASGGST